MIFAAGFGARLSMVSVITSYVPASSTAKLYTLISAIEELSRLIGSPLIQAAWSQGITWGGQFIGFPFLILAVRLTLSLPSPLSKIVRSTSLQAFVHGEATVFFPRHHQLIRPRLDNFQYRSNWGIVYIVENIGETWHRGAVLTTPAKRQRRGCSRD